ncbi:MAG: ABC transporter substrate-binding protein [Desulfomonilaceae bacterium]
MPISRREFLVRVGAGTVFLAGGFSILHAEENQHLRVGLILPDQGPFAGDAKSLLSGFELFLKEKGTSAANIEILKRDPGPEDAKTVDAVADLVMNKRVHVLIGPPSLDGSEKVIHGLAAGNTLLFVTNPSVKLVAGEFCLPGSFRIGNNCYQAAHPLAAWSLKNIGKKAFLTGDDDETGNEQADFFAYGFERSGGAFTDRIMVPARSGKIKDVLDAIAKSKPDFVFASFRHEQSVAFLKAYKSATPTFAQPVIGPDSLTMFPRVLTDLGKNCTGVKTLTFMKNQEEFAGGIKKNLRREVTDVLRAAEGYDLAGIVFRISELNPDQRGQTELIKFVSEIEIVGPRGKLRFDKNHEPILEAMVQQWIPEGQGFKQEIIENIGSSSSVDFGCGRIGFPKRPESGPADEIQLDSGDEDLFGQ